jgi:hypothetical protein
MIKNITRKLKHIIKQIQKTNKKDIYKPLYRLAEIREENDEYIVVIKMIKRNIAFETKPEDILANDFLVDRFSPRDIRTLTYLGYLGVNGPKHKILAQRLSQNEKTTFVLKKKGEKKVILKTADKIIQETNIILGMSSQDAKTIGYAVAAEAAAEEKKQKQALLKESFSQEKTLPKKNS